MTTTLKGIFPDPKPLRRKNFIQENVRNLRKMEQCFHSNKEVGDLQKFQKHQKVDKYQNITAKVNTSLRESKSLETDHNAPSDDKHKNQEHLKWKNSTPALNSKNAVLSKKPHNIPINKNDFNKGRKQKHIVADSKLHKGNNEVDNILEIQSTVKYRNQGIQTLDDKDLDDLYLEGIIRYPTKKGHSKGKSKHNESGDKPNDENFRELHQSQPSDRGDTPVLDEDDSPYGHFESPLPAEEVDFVKLNKQRATVANKLATQLNNGVPPPSYRKGVVPKYLKERKEAHEKEQKAKAEALKSDCPEGHIALPDDERKETLRMLKKNYQDYIKELNMMPIKSDTLRAQRRKIEIEKQLTKLEEGIKVFSKPKVYVKINA